MSAKELLDKVKAMLFDAAPANANVAPTAPAPTTQAGASTVYKTVDGTEVTVATSDPSGMPSVGDMVTIAGAPAPEGVITLEDGSTITVDATGAITALGAPVDMAVDPAPVAAAPVVADPMEARIKTIEELLKQLMNPVTTTLSKEDVTAQVTEVVKPYETRLAKQDEIIKGLFELAEKLVQLPTADPKGLTGNAKDKFEKVNEKEKNMDKYVTAMQELKKKNK